jgi:hypothetical protein
MMTDQPARITPGEIAALLDHARRLTPAAPLADQLSHHKRKAELLSLMAARLGTAEAHQVAAEAWDFVASVARQHHREMTR